ncbi:MAG: 3-methyl-2-oxobutanoate hydroxymethyltransferase [Porticoccaceae bacterium]|nr:3-methyl-2-oxobutanoate hydroxymethyltransferase [Porticoccaceae bacterium]
MTIDQLNAMKGRDEKFSSITAYDFSFAKLIDEAGIEVVLVGDSLGNVVQGRDTTIPVSIDEMAYHTAAVKRGIVDSLLISDMPFMSYATPTDAMRNAAILMQAGAQMVKLEGGEWLEETVYQLTERGLPVCAHLGLTPQSVHKIGGFKIQGREPQAAAKTVADAQLLEQAGAQLLVIECVPASLGKILASELNMPVIGIGAGPDTDAQILVLYDMLGISPKLPRFSKDFLQDTDSVITALKNYAKQVRNGAFPGPEHSFFE